MTTPKQHQLIPFWYPHCLIQADFRPLNVSIVDFEHINYGWDKCGTPPHGTIICYFELSKR